MLPLSIEELENKIQYTFKDKNLILTALTHSSYSNEYKFKQKDVKCNERLEFLGDSVLSIIVSEYLFENYSDCPEGELTCMRAEVVCERALSSYAAQIGLGDYLLLGHGEDKNNGRERKSILADAWEALLAAIYLDAGDNGKKNVIEFLIPFIKKELSNLKNNATTRDFKTLLQQFIQQSEGDFLEYFTVNESGPDHMKTFEVEARLNSNIIGRGIGNTKRAAEQKAAEQALMLFGEI